MLEDIGHFRVYCPNLNQLIMSILNSYSNIEIIKVLSLSLITRINSSGAEMLRGIDRLSLLEKDSDYELAHSFNSINMRLSVLFDKSPYWQTMRQDFDIN